MEKHAAQAPASGPGNNYARPGGQNVGNFLGDRPSSRVLAAPGGNSNVNLGALPPLPLEPARAAFMQFGAGCCIDGLASNSKAA